MLSVQNYAKFSLLKCYVSTCLSETYLDSETLCDDDNLQTDNYSLIRCDHSSNTKRDGVYSSKLSSTKRASYLQEGIYFQLIIDGKLCHFLTLYRSPDQTQDQFESLAKKYELDLDKISQQNPHLVVILGDFHTRSKNRFKNGNTTKKEISHFIKFRTSSNNWWTDHMLYNSSSCIDLLFTYQPNLITEPGVHPSLHFNFHHQIVFAKFNSKIYYPKPYSREVWHYKNASTDLIICAITAFNWERVFSTTNTNKKVAVFNKAILISLEILLLTKLPHVAIEMN